MGVWSVGANIFRLLQGQRELIRSCLLKRRGAIFTPETLSQIYQVYREQHPNTGSYTIQIFECGLRNLVQREVD